MLDFGNLANIGKTVTETAEEARKALANIIVLLEDIKEQNEKLISLHGGESKEADCEGCGDNASI